MTSSEAHMDYINNPAFWQYLSIPVIAALIGWTTNWLAIKLTFLPLNFVGILPPYLGWQGIIPSKARRMASISVDATLSKLGSLSEIFEQFDPEVLSEHIVTTIDPRLEEYVDDVMTRQYETVWENLPSTAKQLVYSRVREEAPELVAALVDDVGENIEQLLDLKDMVIDQLEADKALLNRIFLECGHEEFKFIIHSGFGFGFLFGLIQMAIWYFFENWWILPVCGLLVGYATNWIALNVIFRPVNPVKVGPIKIQGLFLKRQSAVAQSFCDIITQEVLTVRRIMERLLEGPNAYQVRKMITKHVKVVVDKTVGLAKPLSQVVMGLEGFANLKKAAGEKAITISSRTFNDPVFNAERAEVVSSIMRERMEALSPEEFQDLLRPCFQEDEFKLILIGSALGFMAGLAQVIFVFDWQF